VHLTQPESYGRVRSRSAASVDHAQTIDAERQRQRHLHCGAYVVFPAIGGLRQGGESHVWQTAMYSDEWISR